ncbi:MAG: hypothetical protein RR458_04135, partial [Clostridia bacterium]
MQSGELLNISKTVKELKKNANELVTSAKAIREDVVAKSATADAAKDAVASTQETKPIDDAFVKAIDAVSEKTTKVEAKAVEDKLVDAAIKIAIENTQIVENTVEKPLEKTAEKPA